MMYTTRVPADIYLSLRRQLSSHMSSSVQSSNAKLVYNSFMTRELSLSTARAITGTAPVAKLFLWARNSFNTTHRKAIVGAEPVGFGFLRITWKSMRVKSTTIVHGAKTARLIEILWTLTIGKCIRSATRMAVRKDHFVANTLYETFRIAGSDWRGSCPFIQC